MRRQFFILLITASLGAALLLMLSAAAVLALERGKPLGHYARQVWQSKDGLPPGSINSIAQTADGYLWLATEAGLVRFDGVRFKLFDTTPELAGTSIGKLYVSRDGTLWPGARRGRLVSYKDGKFTAYALTEQPLEDHIRAIVEDRHGNLWVGLPGGGVVKFKEGQTATITNKDGLAGNFVMSVAETRDGAVWVGTHGGASRIADGHIITFKEKDGLRNPWVHAIYQARDDSVWLGTFGGGLYRYKDGRLTPLGERDGISYLWTIQEDRAGKIWAGSEGSGLSRFEEGKFISTTTIGNPPGLLPDDSVRSLCEDREGNLWLGLKYGGLASNHVRALGRTDARRARDARHFDSRRGGNLGATRSDLRHDQRRARDRPSASGARAPARPSKPGRSASLDLGLAPSIAESTVKWHITTILTKLGVSDRTQAVRTAIERGIVHL